MTWLRVITPCPILQLGSRVPVPDACYIGMRVVHQFLLAQAQRPRTKKKKEPYREKSVNDSSNELRKPLQRDFIAMSRLIPDLYLALPSFVSGPLRECCEPDRGERWGRRRGQGKGEGGNELTAMRIWVEWPPPRGAGFSAPRSDAVSPTTARGNGRPMAPLP